jgi:hypothetical protein
LLFTQEAGSSGGVIEIPAHWTSTEPPARRSLDCIIGKGVFEGVHPDDHGNIFLAEDAGGVGVSIDPTNVNGTSKFAKQPNSFIYKFEPNNPFDLGEGGKLFALQASVGSPQAPIVFGGTTPAQAFADTYSTAQKDLRTKGSSWPVKWVLVHDTGASVNLSACAAFDANAAAKTAKATPFKRPENLTFLPGSRFDSFVFDETGDTDKRAGDVPELAARGAWGSIFRVDFPWGNSDGEIRIVVIGDAVHASFDNLTFADGETVLATEDRGDTLHDQLNTLDSVWAFDVVDFDRKPARLIALGRDAVAAPTGEEDNEPTGLFVSNGAVSIGGLLGTRKPDAKDDDRDRDDRRFGEREDEHQKKTFRWFVTMQHGLNQVFEILERR